MDRLVSVSSEGAAAHTQLDIHHSGDLPVGVPWACRPRHMGRRFTGR
jgi:hypothetical protein